MAAITAAQVHKVFDNNAADRVCLYEISNVTAADTADLGPSGVVPDYQTVKQAAVMATTIAGTASAACSGTTVTMPAGLSHDAGYLLVWGDTN
ncbi:MAG TPA: hypothetical protein VK817_00805 [Trebonia sp.]|jgi:hypothetical protein|nr:hypothetical protein [Trebonia sp.]